VALTARMRCAGEWQTTEEDGGSCAVALYGEKGRIEAHTYLTKAGAEWFRILLYRGTGTGTPIELAAGPLDHTHFDAKRRKGGPR